MNEWAPAEESRSSSDRWVNPKKWTERAEKGRKFKSWRGRILSSPVSVGYEIWGEDGKPSRAKTAAGLAHIKPRQDGKFGPDKIKRQWAIAFGDVEAGQVVVWTIHQKMIQDGLAEKVTKWGKPENANEPFGYDVVVTQYVKDGKTLYSVDVPGAEDGTARYACPPAIEAEWTALKAAGFDLEALWTGGDPFPSAPAASGSGANVGTANDLPF